MTSHKQPLGHTPGPWHYEADERYGSVFSDEAGEREWNICDLGPPIELICNAAEDVAPAIRDEAEANGRLIAAAPQLLQALQALEPHLDAIVCYASSMDEHEPNRLAFNARAAIAQATGAA